MGDARIEHGVPEIAILDAFQLGCNLLSLKKRDPGWSNELLLVLDTRFGLNAGADFAQRLDATTFEAGFTDVVTQKTDLGRHDGVVYGDKKAVYITIFLDADGFGSLCQHRADNIMPLSTKPGDD